MDSGGAQGVERGIVAEGGVAGGSKRVMSGVKVCRDENRNVK